MIIIGWKVDMAQFEVIVHGLIHKNGKILVGKKPDNIPHPIQGQWHFMGGRLEYDENIYDAVKREVKEEAGIDINVIKVIDVYTKFSEWPKESGIKSHWNIHIIFECIPVDDKIPVASDDVSELKWIDAKDVQKIVTGNMITTKIQKFLETVK